MVRADAAAHAKTWRADTANPPDLTPVAVVTLSQRALDDARAVTIFIADSYGSAVPPPPWPASPEMVAAAKKVQAAHDGAEVIVRRKADAKWKEPAKVRAVLLRDGGELYAATLALVDRFASAPRAPDIRAVLPDPLDFLKGVPTYVLILGLWWFLEGGRKKAPA